MAGKVMPTSGKMKYSVIMHGNTKLVGSYIQCMYICTYKRSRTLALSVTRPNEAGLLRCLLFINRYG